VCSRGEPTTAERPKTGSHATDPRGPNGTPTRRPPREGYCLSWILTQEDPSMKGGINDGRCGTDSRDQSIPEQTHVFIVRSAWFILPILWTSPLRTVSDPSTLEFCTAERSPIGFGCWPHILLLVPAISISTSLLPTGVFEYYSYT
jgi:hypothetical protein